MPHQIGEFPASVIHIQCACMFLSRRRQCRHYRRTRGEYLLYQGNNGCDKFQSFFTFVFLQRRRVARSTGKGLGLIGSECNRNKFAFHLSELISGEIREGFDRTSRQAQITKESHPRNYMQIKRKSHTAICGIA